MTKPASKSARIGLIVTAAIAALLVAAWIDGGEEPLRQISVPVVLPGAGA